MELIEKKSIWNCHILDKLYFVNRSHQCVDDIPITSICVEDRCIAVNGICVSPVDMRISDRGITYYLNKSEAEEALKTIVL